MSSSELRNDKTGCPRERPAEVGFLLVDGFSMLAYAAAVESLRAANQIAGRPFYRWHNISTDGHPSAASNGIPFQCKSASDFTQPLDYLFVCASDTAADFRDPHTFAWLRALASKGTKLGGISGGAFLLARAGLLKNRRVTLHWVYAPAFSEEFPEINLRRSLYEIDGDRITCGGGMSPLDMMHALLGQQHGEDLAVGVSEFFLHTDIREGQKPQRLSFQARLGASHRGLIRALEAMENALEEPLSRALLAGIACVSERQLDRLFLAQVGAPLGSYYLQLRLERARQLVLQSTLAHQEIAVACGFRSASTFSKAYSSHFGVPPSSERATVQRSRRRLEGT